MKSPYLSPTTKESLFRRIIRYLYATYLDELYIPRGTRVAVSDKEVHLVSSMYPHKWVEGYCRTDGQYKKRKGVQEKWLPISKNFVNTHNSIGTHYKI